MKKLLPILILFSACTHIHVGEEFIAEDLTPRKQKQKIAVLRKKLELAKREEQTLQKKVERCQEEMERAEIALVEKVITACERMVEQGKAIPSDVSALFLYEREILHRLIESGPSPTSLEAQRLLDQILRIITNVSDKR